MGIFNLNEKLLQIEINIQSLMNNSKSQEFYIPHIIHKMYEQMQSGILKMYNLF